MLRLLFRLLYNITVYPAALLIWRLRRREVLKHSRCAKVRLTRVPPITPRRGRFGRASLTGLADALEQAAVDPLVSGLFVSLDGFSASAVEFFDLAVLLDRFKRSGKRLHVFIERADWRSLIAGRAADRLTTDPSGPVMVHGMGIEVPFIGELLDRHGISFQVRQRGDYKGAMEPLVRSEPSPQFRESLHDLVDGLFERAAEELAHRPGMELSHARAALEEGPYTVTQAVGRKLIDAAVPAEEAENEVANACGAIATSQAAPSRLRSPRKGALSGLPLRQVPEVRRVGIVRPAPFTITGAPRVAFVPIDGLIVDRPLGIGRGHAAVASELVPRIRGLADTRGVEALVLVVDSRGGTASASDMIWGAIRYALGKKPVVAWMRSYAASGGYYVAVAAERIIASPFTITGSIGVVASKPNVGRAAGRFGIHPISVTRGRGAVLFSPFQPLTEDELAWLDSYVDESYKRFTSVVAEGRRMSPEAVEQNARGRVWTGPQAHERGLIDRVGAFPDVVDAARELAAIPARTRHQVVWAGPREGLLRMAQRIAAPAAARSLDPGLDILLELELLSRQPDALYYLPIVWR